MRPLRLALALLLAARAAAAQAPPDPSREPPPPVEEAGYYERCFGVPQPGPGRVHIYGEVPISGGHGGGSISSVPHVSGSSDEKAWLILAVVAVAVLPIVIWGLDDEAPPIVAQRFACPTFGLDFSGGAQASRVALGNDTRGATTARFTFGVGHVATDLQLDLTSDAVNSFASHLLIRPTPKAHVEGGFAFGYRRMVFRGQVETGLEIGLPHRYALWRDELRTIGLELRPMLLFGGHGVEPSLEGAFVFPLHQVLHLRLGGTVFTFAGAFFWNLQAGFTLTL